MASIWGTIYLLSVPVILLLRMLTYLLVSDRAIAPMSDITNECKFAAVLVSCINSVSTSGVQPAVEVGEANNADNILCRRPPTVQDQHGTVVSHLTNLARPSVADHDRRTFHVLDGCASASMRGNKGGATG